MSLIAGSNHQTFSILEAVQCLVGSIASIPFSAAAVLVRYCKCLKVEESMMSSALASFRNCEMIPNASSDAVCSVSFVCPLMPAHLNPISLPSPVFVDVGNAEVSSGLFKLDAARKR